MAHRSSFYREGTRGPASSFVRPYVELPPAPIDTRMIPPAPVCHNQPMRHDYGGDFRCPTCHARVHVSTL